MARIFQDGFELGVPLAFGAFSNPGIRRMSFWEEVSSGTTHAGNARAQTSNVNSGAYSFRTNRNASSGSGYHLIRGDIKGNKTEIYGRVEFRPANSVHLTVIGLSDENGDASLCFAYEGTDLKVLLGTTTLGTMSGALVLNTYNRIEWHIVVGDTNGLIEAKINGNNLFSWNGDTKETRTDYIRYLYLGYAGASLFATYGSDTSLDYFDDIAVNDTTGTINNSWCGKGSILLLKPKGVGNYSQFTPSNESLQNWEMVDEVPHDSDTTYVSSETADHIDTYEMEELVADKGIDPTELVVKAVQVCLTGRYEGVDAHLAPMLRSGTTDHEGDVMTMASSYYRLFDAMFDVNPFTSAAWTYEEVDALEAGIKHKAHVE